MNRKAKITAGLKKVQAEGQGIMQVTFVWQEDVPALIVSTLLTEDREALFQLRVAQAGLKALASTPTLCLLCDARPKVTEVAAVCCMHAAVDSPELSVAFVICHRCADRPRKQTLDAVSNKIVGGFTNVRRIEIHATGGNA